MKKINRTPVNAKLQGMALYVRSLFVKGYKLILSLYTALVAATFLSPTVYAEGGGDAIQSSQLFTGLMKLLNDTSTALLIGAPILCGILIGVFAVIQGMQTEPHDKEKWAKNKKTVLIVLIWVFGATSLVAIVTSYFKG